MRKLIGGFFLSLCVAAGSAEPEPENAIQSLRSKIRNLETTLQQVRQKSKDAPMLSQVEKQIGQLEDRSREIQAKIKAQNLQLAYLEARIQAAESDRQVQQQLLAKQLQIEARHPAQAGGQLLFSSQDLSQTQRLLHAYQQIRQAQHAKLTQLSLQLETQQKERALLLAQREALNQLESELSHQQVALQDKRAQRLTLVKDKHDPMHEKPLSQQYEEQIALESLLVTLHQKPLMVAQNSSFASQRGMIAPPIPITKVPSKPGSAFIRSAEGTPVQAIYPGKVIYADWLKGFGFLLIVDHADGYLSLYGHNQTLYKKVGESVAMGDLVARVGQTGGIPQSGLYFEIRKDGHSQKISEWISRNASPHSKDTPHDFKTPT